MTRDQHLEFCNRCKNRKFDAMQGTICNITSRVADFENTCENFQLDETVKIEKALAEEEKVVPNFKYITELSESTKAQLRGQQDVVYAIIGGLAAAIVGALLWAFITVTTKYQIGYMAIGVGFLVGFAVRYYGAGIDKYFGFIGAFFALFGCALGNLLSQVAFVADAESLGYFETISALNLEIIFGIYEETFSPMDVLFYSIAAYEGFKFAFRNVTDDLVQNLNAGKIEPPPFAQFRLPTVIVLFLLLCISGFVISRGTVGVKTFYYEGGAKRSIGELVNGKENGPWESWWENGKLQYQGFFANGKQDSSWKFYDEEGTLVRKGSFKHALMHGLWIDYYGDGQITNSGPYAFGRVDGLWTYYFPNGKISQKGFYHLDLQDSTWETYYDNGNMASKGSYKMGIPSGEWTNWNEDGVMTQQLQYTAEGTQRVLNTWTLKGKPEVVNGNGIFKIFYEDGTVQETCVIKDGNRNGAYVKYYSSGKPEEEGEYRDGIYHLANAWTQEGTPIVVKGEGQFKNTSGENAMYEVSGLIKNGLKVGKWTISSADSKLDVQESNYVEGKLEGPNISYFEDGMISVEGSFSKDKRQGKWTWFHQTGKIESVINFVDGKKEGDQYFYSEEGDLLRTEVYKDGKLIGTKVPD